MGRRDRFASWMPLATALFGMTFYTATTKGLALATADIQLDTTLKRAATTTGEAAALLHYRAAAVLTEISAFACAIVSVSLLAMFLERASARFHLTVLSLLAVAAAAVNAAGPSPVTSQLHRLACPPEPRTSDPLSFCARAAEPTIQWTTRFGALDFHQLLHLPLAAAAACIGYAAFTLGVAGRSCDAAATVAYEKAIAVLVACGGTMLIFSTLVERQYARWATSGIPVGDDVSALVDGVTFYSGATSSALLAMIWLFAIGLLAFQRNGGVDAGRSHILSRGSAAFGLLAVLGPTLLAIVQRLF